MIMGYLPYHSPETQALEDIVQAMGHLGNEDGYLIGQKMQLPFHAELLPDERPRSNHRSSLPEWRSLPVPYSTRIKKRMGQNLSVDVLVQANDVAVILVQEIVTAATSPVCPGSASIVWRYCRFGCS